MVAKLTSREQHTDPRSARTRQRVIQSGVDLLRTSGTSALTVDALIQRSGVARSTIYRHWPNSEQLVSDIISHALPEPPSLNEAASLSEGIGSLLRQLADQFNEPGWAALLASLLALRHSQGPLVGVEQDVEKRHDRLVSEIRRLAAQQHLDDRLPPDAHILPMLLGPLLFASLQPSHTIDESLIATVRRSLLLMLQPDPQSAD